MFSGSIQRDSFGTLLAAHSSQPSPNAGKRNLAMHRASRTIKRSSSGPKSFSLHWGSGVIAEEVRVDRPYHCPAIQLLEFREGPAAPALQIRFCYYDHQGRFQRSPLIVDESDLDALASALKAAPRLRAMLRRLSGAR
jgi:hypothetical protein